MQDWFPVSAFGLSPDFSWHYFAKKIVEKANGFPIGSLYYTTTSFMMEGGEELREREWQKDFPEKKRNKKTRASFCASQFFLLLHMSAAFIQILPR